MTTGRATLVREVPEWEGVETPPVGQLLELSALETMLVKAAAFFEAAALHGCETEAVLRSAA